MPFGCAFGAAIRLECEGQARVRRSAPERTSAVTLAVGARLGPYEIVGAVGKGGMGEVYKARDTRLDRMVAIKVLPRDLTDVLVARQRLEREARAAAALAHPHICTLLDVGRHNDIDYLVMEYLAGETLASRMRRGKLPLDETLTYGRQMAEALAAAHRAGIVHRDLKPANVMVTNTGATLLDFGLAKSRPVAQVADATTLEPLTQIGTIVGTLQYMAPEQLEGKEADARTDMFAFGLIIFEMLTGCKAFQARSDAALIANVLHGAPPAPSSLEATVPPGLDRVVRRCLAKDPEERFQSGTDLAFAFEGLSGASTTGGGAALAVPQRSRRSVWPAAALVALALSAVALFVGTRFVSLLPVADRSSGPQLNASSIASVVALPSRVSGHTDDQFLADAIPNSISAELVRVRGLETKVPPSSIDVQRLGSDAARVAEAYRVSALVLSSVSAEGDLLVLNVQLVDPRTRRLIWSADFRGQRGNYLALVHQAADALRLQLRPAAATLDTRAVGTGSSAAELAFQRGRHFSDRYNNRHDRNDFDRAIASFREALDLSPSMADAAAGIGYLHVFKLEAGAPLEVMLPEIERWARLAVQLDPRSSRGWALLASAEDVSPRRDPHQGLVYSLRAASLGSRDAFAHNELGFSLATTSLTLANAAFRESARIDPMYLYPQLALSGGLCALARCQEALDIVEHVLRSEPGLPLATVVKAQVLIRLGRSQEALQLVARLKQFQVEGRIASDLVTPVEYIVKATIGDSSSRRHALDELYRWARGSNSAYSASSEVYVSLLRGSRTSEAASLIERSVDTPYELFARGSAFTATVGDAKYKHLADVARDRFKATVTVLDEARASNELPRYLDEQLREMLPHLGLTAAPLK
jgi:serine/threonine protein kinase/tetratricopeptide (TPR) repeat protein